ncbi:MAG: GNAT family N-acetyltransferase [bacterium]|nr:GNAT family N-acetyltransferase [bacterium]
MVPVQEAIAYDISNKSSGPSELVKSGEAQRFLHKHLEEYGDALKDIQKAANYVFERGGQIIVQLHKDEIAGVVLLNETGMSGYIPENILVYIAVNQKFRGRGFGKDLMRTAINSTEGDIALHVEKNNPARFLYEKLGFTNPYLEMRLKRS